jgi:hypothetical protein
MINQMSRKVALPNRSRTSIAGAVFTVALMICGVYVSSAVAGEEIVALPTVHVVTKAITFHHKRALLVKSIAVSNIDGALRVSCDRCRRYSTKIHETHPTPTTQVLSGVSWIIILGRDIQIAVSDRGQTGRFVLLGAGLDNTLAFKASGCLTAKVVRRVDCPRTAPAAPVGSTVPGGNPTVSSKPETPKLEGSGAPVTEEPVKTKSTSGATPSEPSPSPSAPSSEPPPPSSPTTYSETTGSVVHTWTDYSNAGGNEGPEIPSNDTVQIACKLEGFRVADGNTWWYRIASSPWSSSYYGSADAFYNNGATSGSLKGTPFVDPNVPNC